MQYSFYKPNELEGQNDVYIRSNLDNDYKFAERILDERTIILPKQVQDGVDETRGVMEGIWFYTAGRRWWLISCWVIELIVVLYLLVSFTYEAVKYCPLELGVGVYCQRCFDVQFLTFGYIFVLFWLGNLWAYVLLISRGFSWRLRGLNDVIHANRGKGIPGIAVIFWFFTVILNAVLLLIGIYVIYQSHNCVNDLEHEFNHGIFDGHALRGRGLRSDFMYWNVLSSLIAYVLLSTLGRMANGGQRRAAGEDPWDSERRSVD